MAPGGQILILSQYFRAEVAFPCDRMALAPEILILWTAHKRNRTQAGSLAAASQPFPDRTRLMSRRQGRHFASPVRRAGSRRSCFSYARSPRQPCKAGGFRVCKNISHLNVPIIIPRFVNNLFIVKAYTYKTTYGQKRVYQQRTAVGRWSPDRERYHMGRCHERNPVRSSLCTGC